MLSSSVFAVIFPSLNCCEVDIELFLNVIFLSWSLLTSYIWDLFSANTSSAPELLWQSLLGAALSSCHKLPRRINHNDLEEALSMAKDYKSCVQVLTPVADFLDTMHR